jgi:hypothetical protein
MLPGAGSPTPAERARSLLLAADSLSVDWAGGRHEAHRSHHCGPGGRLTLDLPLATALARQVGGPVGGQMGGPVASLPGPRRLPVRLHLTDIAPVPTPERVRAQLTVTGWLRAGPVRPRCAAHRDGHGEPADVLAVPVEIGDLSLSTGGATVPVEVEQYRRAEPDPLALVETGQLTHLARDHADALDLLTRLLEDRHLMGAQAVVPHALDRYGIVLRVLRRDGRTDVRLPFRSRAAGIAQAGAELRRLLVEATACRSWPSPAPRRPGIS